MPWMMNAPSRIAMPTLEGRPRESRVTMEPAAAALFAVSGAATPSIVPVPNFSGCFEMRFSTV